MDKTSWSTLPMPLRALSNNHQAPGRHPPSSSCGHSPHPGTPEGENIEAQGNHTTDAAAQKAATEGYEACPLTVGLLAPGMGTLPPTPEYSPSDREWIQAKGTNPEDPDGWYRDSARNLLLPSYLEQHLCLHLHQTTHLGEKNIASFLQTARLRFPRQKAIIQEITHSCKACQMMAPGKRKGQHTGIRLTASDLGYTATTYALPLQKSKTTPG
ncbi:uncharacterized protein LOC129537053 isoform X2 [Moschus berezovskii]|uniref:uncharacterized protein LOC129537053 isoform X2 n=1 Tax=Moschus berezovskii TaxID=68408 RepID=UPI00244464AD|nr:uncharacterized protein LOC129537053 isoform X2 [Moschus berezovskii]